MKKLLLLIPLSLLLFSCSKENPEQKVSQEDGTETTTKSRGGFYEGEIVVEFDDNMLSLIGQDLNAGKLATKSMGLNQTLDELGIKSIEREFPHSEEYEARHIRAGLHRFYIVTFDEKHSLTKAESEFSVLPGVISVSKRPKMKISSYNDPGAAQQWFFPAVGSDSYYKYMNVDQVWSKIEKGKSNVIVAVQDEGVNLTHSDLSANTIKTSGGSGNFYSSGYSPYVTPGDHGTHVAGVISAVNNNGIGISSVAGGDAAANISGVKIMSLECLSEDETKDGGSFPNAFVWAADHGAVISQNSWGYPADQNGDGIVSSAELRDYRTYTIPSDLKSAIDYFIDYAGTDANGNQKADSPMKGGIVFFAAGNENLDYNPVAVYDRVLAVGAYGSNLSKADFSNYGSWVDLAAPGVGIYSTVVRGYGNMSGTSMACPMASGVAALAVSYYGGQGFTSSRLREMMLKGSREVSGSKVGRYLDAYGVLIAGGDFVPKGNASFIPVAKSNSISYKITTTASEKKSIKAARYLLLASKTRSSLENFNAENKPSDVFTYDFVVPTDSAGSNVITGTLSGLEFNTDYYVSVMPGDYAKNYATKSAIQTVRTGDNNPPVIEFPSESIVIKKYQTYNIPIKIYDPDGHNVKTSSNSTSDAIFFKNVKDSEYELEVTAPRLDAGEYSVEITAQDIYGKSLVKVLKFTVLENRAPKVLKQIDDILTSQVGLKQTFNSDEYFTDEDGEPLTYTFSISNKAVAYILKVGDKMNLSTIGYGLSEITITATDFFGKKVNNTFKVLVRDPNVNMEAYPNPVADVLNIRTGEEAVPTHIRLVSQSGRVVVDKEETFDAFNPYALDVTALAPGQYKLFVTYGGNTYQQNIIKK